MEVKDLIKAKRMEQHLTLQDVANYVGVNKATVQKWESGKIDQMRGPHVAKLGNLLHIHPAVLMGWMTPEEANQLITSDRAKRAIKDVFVHYGILREDEEVTQEMLEACMPAVRAIVDAIRQQKQ